MGALDAGGLTIRNFWRLRYLPVFSYGWLMSVLSWWQFFVSWAAYLMVFVVRPAEGHLSIAPVLIILLSSYLVALRNLLIRRSDHSPLQTLDTWLLAPLNLAWSLVVLRPARIYGTLTCSNNGWGTRGKVEVGIADGDALPTREDKRPFRRENRSTQVSHPADGEGRPATRRTLGLIASILVGLTVISGCSLGGLSSEIKQAGAPSHCPCYREASGRLLR